MLQQMANPELVPPKSSKGGHSIFFSQKKVLLFIVTIACTSLSLAMTVLVNHKDGVEFYDPCQTQMLVNVF